MIATTRASLTVKIAVSLACVACAALIPVAVAAGAAAKVTYIHENLKEYEQQLDSAKIQSATFNKKVRSLHLLLKDGRHMLLKYAAHEEPKLAAQLAAKGVPVTAETKAQAAKEPAKPVKHKLRYIAGGIVIVVAIVVGAVLLVDRKRKRAAE